MTCIEERPPKWSTVKCFSCGVICEPGKRRRDPFGSYYCPRHGCRVQRRVRHAVASDPELTYFVVAVPGFLRFVAPDKIGLGAEYEGVKFCYRAPPKAFPMHKPRPVGFPCDCHRCGRKIPRGASESRRGVNAHTVYCAVCGLSVRRAAYRINNANQMLINMYSEVPSMAKFLRPDIRFWLASCREGDLLDKIIHHG